MMPATQSARTIGHAPHGWHTVIIRYAVMLACLITASAAIIVAVGAQPSPATLPVIIAVVAVLIPAIMFLTFHMLWRPIFAKYPKQPVGLDAESRSFQSFSVSIVNMGFSVHATTDAEFLHLEPVWILQAFGASPASVPWTALTPTHDPRWPRVGRAVRLDGHFMTGPAWCLDRVYTRAAE